MSRLVFYSCLTSRRVIADGYVFMLDFYYYYFFQSLLLLVTVSTLCMVDVFTNTRVIEYFQYSVQRKKERKRYVGECARVFLNAD